MPLKAIKTRLIIKKQQQNTTTTSGIFIGQALLDGASVYAEVVDVGPKVTADIKVGDLVLPDWRAVVPVVYEGETYLIVEEMGIHGVLDQ